MDLKISEAFKGCCFTELCETDKWLLLQETSWICCQREIESESAKLNKQTASHVLYTKLSLEVLLLLNCHQFQEPRAKCSCFWLAGSPPIQGLPLAERCWGGVGAAELRSAQFGRLRQSGSDLAHRWYRPCLSELRWVVIVLSRLLAAESLITLLPDTDSETLAFDCNNRQDIGFHDS